MSSTVDGSWTDGTFCSEGKLDLDRTFLTKSGMVNTFPSFSLGYLSKPEKKTGGVELDRRQFDFYPEVKGKGERFKSD